MSFPTTLHTAKNSAGTDTLSNTAGTTHSALHDQLETDVAALTTKVGIDSSADTNSLDYKVTQNSLAIAGGWNVASGTWTYLSATTITVPSDATTIYSVGDKIRLTQTTVKYFSIVAITTTVLTITGGSDYTLTNAAITSPYYSKVATPIGFPSEFNYAPSPTGFSANPSTIVARFHIMGKTCTFWIATNNGTSNATTITYALPIAARTDPGNAWRAFGKAVDNGVALTTAGLAEIASGGTIVSCYKDAAGDPWTNSGAKNFQLPALTYEI